MDEQQNIIIYQSEDGVIRLQNNRDRYMIH